MRKEGGGKGGRWALGEKLRKDRRKGVVESRRAERVIEFGKEKGLASDAASHQF